MATLPGYSQPHTFNEQIQKDEAHPRQHALAMASATHLKNMGHIDQATCDGIHKRCSKALGKKLKPNQQQASLSVQRPDLVQPPQAPMSAPFGSFAPK